MITILVLVVWIPLGPIAMAFGGCAGMGAMCDSPCGLTFCVMPAPIGTRTVLTAVDLQVERFDHLAKTTLKIPEPPPKSVSLAA